MFEKRWWRPVYIIIYLYEYENTNCDAINDTLYTKYTAILSKPILKTQLLTFLIYFNEIATAYVIYYRKYKPPY